MLTITATNFGINPADIQVNEFHTDNMLILDGEFEVDTTASEYAGIRPMKLTVADLPFSKSRESTAIVMAESSGVKYCTLTKVRITDKNTIVIDKVIAYKDLGYYTVKLSTVLIPTMITGEVALNSPVACNPVVQVGQATGLDVKAVVTDDWLMLVVKASTLTFDETSETVEISLPEIPSVFYNELPMIYNENLWSTMGSKFYPATLMNSVLTISKDGAADEATGTGSKFCRLFIVK